MRLAPFSDGTAAVHDGILALYDLKGERVGEQKLDKRAESVARFGDEWLVRSDKQKHLARVIEGASSPFAAGKTAIGLFSVGRDDTVAVTRGESIELWSRDDELRWSAAGGPFTQAVVARDHVVALAEDGALVFFARDKGEPLGALRLASTDPSTDWRLAHVDGGIVVLALGEWIVWIDAAKRKTVRRVRARAKVCSVAADVNHVAVAVEDGFVQAFRATTGEPRATFVVDEKGLSSIALGAAALFTIGGAKDATVRATDRTTLDVTEKVASPIASLATRGSIAAVGDRTGRVRIFDTAGGGMRELGTLSVGESRPGEKGAVGVHIASKESAVVAAGTRVIMRAAAPYTKPRPTVLKPGAAGLPSPPSAFTADEGYAFAGNTSGEVDVYDLASGRVFTTYALSEDDRITAVLRLAGALLVVGTGALDGRVLFVDVVDAKVVHRVSPHDEAFGVTCLAADARGRLVASGSDDSSIALIDPTKGKILAKIRVAETPVSLAFEPTGRRLAAVFADGTAAIIGFASKGATVSDLGLRGASHVAWGESLVFGFKDGRIESGDRHAPSSERPGARP